MASHLLPIYGTQKEWRAVYHLLNYYKASQCPCATCKNHVDTQADLAILRIRQLIVAAAFAEDVDE